MRIICSNGSLSHSEPLFKKLNVLKINGMFKLQLFKFWFDLINNNLPAYFINMSSLLQPVIYHHTIRQKLNYSVARVKHVFAQKCMRFCIPDILNKSSNLITDKIQTHSRKGFSVYLKCFLAMYVQKLLFRNTLWTLYAGPLWPYFWPRWRLLYTTVLWYFISMQSANFNVFNIFNLCLCVCVDK